MSHFRSLKTRTLFSTVAIAALALTPALGDETGSFGDIDRLEINDLIGAVEVRTGPGSQTHVTITDGGQRRIPGSYER